MIERETPVRVLTHVKACTVEEYAWSQRGVIGRMSGFDYGR